MMILFKNDKIHRYYPDIFLKCDNKFIEVKSSWTYDTHVEEIKLKCESVVKLGYDIDVWVLEKDGKIINELKFRGNRNV